MTPAETTTILRQYREWLCDTPKSVRPHTRQINEAIDAAVEMIDRLEAAEKDIALKERVIDSLGLALNAVAHERDNLRAKIEEMEQQEPSHWGCSVLQPDGRWTEEVSRETPPEDYFWVRDAFPLYLAPGAKGEGK